MKTETYPAPLPTMSIVICYHNEALSTLLRTVHSLINNTPLELISSIILVNDASSTNYGTNVRSRRLKIRFSLIKPVQSDIVNI